MKRIELSINNAVFFDEEKHEYWLGDKELNGITKMLQRQLFPNEYANIPNHILEAAARYGKEVHLSIEDFDANWINDATQELMDYIEICHSHNLIHEASEYLVSDNKDWASSIDKVYRTGDNTFSLADIKTYGVMNADKLEKARWQLSIYAYLFELQNKGAEVDGLYILHIRNKVKKDGTFDHISNIIPVKRIPTEICKELLDTDLRNEQFENPYLIPDNIREKEELIRSLIQIKQETEDQLATIKAQILSDMEANNAKTWATDSMKITRKMPTQRQSFNLAAYKKDNPDLDLSSYMKMSEVSGSILIAI